MLHRIATDLTYCTTRLDRDEFREPNQTHSYSRELMPEETQVLEPLLDDGFTIVGCGIARCVLRFPKSSPANGYVVKLPRFGVGPVSHGAVQNQREVLLWKRHGEAGNWPLAPVVEYESERFAWLAMPYGEPLEELPETEQERSLQDVRSQVRFLPDFDMREVVHSNIVLIDDEPLIADYGLPDGM